MSGTEKLTGAAAQKASGKTAIQIWLDEETLADLDAACQTRYGKLPRSIIVMTAINEFLDRENA